MKKLLLSLSCLLISLCVYCQDIIVKKNTDELQVKILEVGINEIKYKNWNNQEGPTYVINKSDIFMIKYANGDKESFITDTDNSSSANLSNSNYVTYEYDPKLKSYLRINGEIASVEQTIQIFGQDTYNQLRSNAIGSGLGLGFVAVGIPVLIAGMALSMNMKTEGYYHYYPYLTPGLICMGIGAALTAAGLPMAILLPKKNKRIINSYSGELTSLTHTKQVLTFGATNNGLGLVLKF